MVKNTMIGVDLAKNAFQLHGASTTGHVKFRKKPTRAHFRRFMAEEAPAVFAMEACGSAHSPAAFLRLQGEAWARLQGRSGRYLPAADHRGDVTPQLDGLQDHTGRIMVSKIVPEEVADAGRDCLG